MRGLRRQRHGMHVAALLTVMAGAGAVRRGVRAQMHKRRLERRTRIRVLVLARHMRRRRMPWREVAARVGVATGTLRQWERRWREDRLAVRPRGRRLRCAARHVRNQVFATLGLLGPGTSIAALRELFGPELVGLRELRELSARFNRVWKKRGVMLHVLKWSNDASVWAMDFTEPASPIDGMYRYVLLVRDLGSGKTLLSQPMRSANADGACAALRRLFAAHGPPLVIKSDNGSAFIATKTLKLLEDFGVLLLRSPPQTPRYNGACEAGVGAIKSRAHLLAAMHDRPEQWTCDDLEGARLMANETARPNGRYGPTPDQLWVKRAPLYGRAALQAAAREATNEERARLLEAIDRDLSVAQECNAERIGIVRALIERGHLQLRRRRFSLPVRNQK